jgi:hypothetical protein
MLMKAVFIDTISRWSLVVVVRINVTYDFPYFKGS